MDETIMYMIGGFIILSLFVIMIILLWFRRKQKKLLKNVPSEDFKTLNYDDYEVRKRQAIKEISNNKKEVSKNAESDKIREDWYKNSNNIPDIPVPTEDSGVGGTTPEHQGGGDVEERHNIPEGGNIRPKPDSNSFGRTGGRPSWR